MVSKTVLCKVGSVALFLVGAGLFIFGFLVIGTVDDLLKDGVKKSLKLESGDIDEKFINSTNVKYYAYVYNISNWNEFAAGTALPTYNLLGPYIYQEYAIKYNMSFSPDGTTFKYNEYWIYEPLTDRATTDVVYTANLVFGGLFGGFYQSLQSSLSPTNAAFAAGIRPDSLLDESKLLGHTLLPSVHPVAADQFVKKDLIPVAAANTFRGFLPATTFGTYISAALATATGYCGNITTMDELATQWATKSIVPNGIAACGTPVQTGGFSGFEIGTVLASVGISLFNTSSGASFRSSTGQQTWAAAIAGDATANAGLNASLSVFFTPIKNHLNQLWFNNSLYEKVVVGAISGSSGLDKGFFGGKWTAPELIATGAVLNETDFTAVGADVGIFNRYKGLWAPAELSADNYGDGFDKLAALQFATGALTASTQASTFLTTSLKALFGLNGVGENAVNLDGLEYARYMGKTIVDQFNAGGAAKTTIINNNAACQPFLDEANPLNVSRFLGCVYMYNALSVKQARAVLNKTKVDSTAIVTWSIVRVNLLYPNTTIRAQTINGLLGLTDSDPIPKEKIDQLSNYFCYELPLAVYKGRMFLNSGYTDYKTGGLFRKLTPDQVFRGYNDQFVPAAVAPGFFASTLASYTTQETAFAASPYSPHELYTGTSDIQKARWWKSYRGVSNLTTWEDTYVEDISISEVASRTTRLTEAQRIIPRDGGKVWKSSEIIDGTSDGKTAGPFQEDNQVEERNNLYVSQARRSARLYKTGDVTTFKGIKLVRYRFNVKTVQNATTNTDNDKYYMDKPYATSQFSCPNGLVPLQRMARGAPVFLSQAGFYNVDPSVTAPYTITQTLFDVPDEVFSSSNTDRWDTYLDMEPFSGATMRAHKRLQVNMWLPKTWFKPQAGVINVNAANTGFLAGPDSQVHAKFFNQVPNDSAPSGVPDTKSNLFVPISIYDENGEILDDDAKTFRQKIYDNRDLADNLRIIFIVVGAFFMIVALGCLYHFSRKTGMDRLESKADLTN